jgi:hypothetical protein
MAVNITSRQGKANSFQCNVLTVKTSRWLAEVRNGNKPTFLSTVIFSFPYYGSSTTDSCVSRFTICLLNYDSLAANIAVTGWWYRLLRSWLLNCINWKSTPLVQQLHPKKTTAFRRTKLGNHEYCFYQKDLVTMLSTFSARRLRCCKGIESDIEKPTVVLEYPRFVGGIDRADQFCGCYRFTIKS